MAFFSKVGSILKQTASRQINSELSASRPSIYQAIRCMSSSKLFIGGLSYSTDDQSLREAFSKYGQVVESRVILDRETGRSRGFGFITFSSMEEASSAIQAMDGQDLHGRYVRVNYATDKRGGSSGYGRGGGGYGSGGYGNNSYSGGGGYGGGGYGNNSGPGSGGYGGNYGGNYGNVGYGNNSHGGNVSSGGAGDFFGGNSGGYGSSSGNFGVAAGGSGTDGGYDGNVLDGNTFESGNSGGFSGGNFSVAGGGGGTDGGYDENTGSDSNQIGNVDGAAAGGFDEDVTLDGNYQDRGEDADDFAKRA